MAHEYKKPTPTMVDMRANPEKALVMKDMGNGHMRPYMWGTSITVASGETQALVASGKMGGVFVEDCVYSPCVVNVNTNCYLAKDSNAHTVKVVLADAATGDGTKVDVMVFMSTATDVDVSDYVGKRGYLPGTN